MPPVPPVPVPELLQLVDSRISRMRPSIIAQDIEEEQFTRRTRNSIRMPGNRVVRLGSQRRSRTPRMEISTDEMVDRVGGRQHRVASVPDQRVVEQVRREERERGGPSAPRNSLDLSVFGVNETIDVDDGSDADGDSIEEDSIVISDLDGNEHENDPSVVNNRNEYLNIQGVPPLIPSSMINALDGEEPDADADGLDMTIDLTESPVRRTRSVSIPNIPRVLLPPPSSSPVASPKCPVCFESFRSIHRKGHRLVSTLCGHVFCGRCLPACVRTSGHCPTCRKRIGYDDFHPLFLF